MHLALAIVALLAQTAAQDPESVRIELTHGILGGKAPPTVFERVTISRRGDRVVVTTMTRVNDVRRIHRMGSMTVKQLEALLKEIDGMWALPVEKPAGSEDIYGMNVGLLVRNDKKSWKNDAPQGCVRSTSEVQAIEEQKAAFAKIVEAVRKAGADHATKGDD